MMPINNSDTAWLIVSDWNQENGKFYEELREDILNPEINSWYYEYYHYADVAGGQHLTGSYNTNERHVGTVCDQILNASGHGGYGGVGGGFVIRGSLVGEYDPH